MTYNSAICKASVQGFILASSLNDGSHGVPAVFRQECSTCLADNAPDVAPADHRDTLCLRI